LHSNILLCAVLRHSRSVPYSRYQT
jgi:hypothetical protein